MDTAITFSRKLRAVSSKIVVAVEAMPSWHPLRGPLLDAFDAGIRIPDICEAAKLAPNTFYNLLKPKKLGEFGTIENLLEALGRLSAGLEPEVTPE